MYAAKICAVVVVTNVLGLAIYKAGQRRSGKPTTEALRHGEERENLNRFYETYVEEREKDVKISGVGGRGFGKKEDFRGEGGREKRGKKLR